MTDAEIEGEVRLREHRRICSIALDWHWDGQRVIGCHIVDLYQALLEAGVDEEIIRMIVNRLMSARLIDIATGLVHKRPADVALNKRDGKN